MFLTKGKITINLTRLKELKVNYLEKELVISLPQIIYIKIILKSLLKKRSKYLYNIGMEEPF